MDPWKHRESLQVIISSIRYKLYVYVLNANVVIFSVDQREEKV